MGKPLEFNKEELKTKLMEMCSQLIDNNLDLVIKCAESPKLEDDELLGKLIRLGTDADKGDIHSGLELGILVSLMSTIMDK